MKAFFERYSYSAIKMFVNQFALAIFGLAVSMGVVSLGNPTLTILSSVFAIAFYLCLLYFISWDMGAKDRIAVDTGSLKKNLWTGVLVSLVANSINILLALLFVLANIEVLSFLQYSRLASILLEGMYLGVLSVKIGGNALNGQWWAHFLIILPALITSGVGYILGFREFRLIKPKAKGNKK